MDVLEIELESEDVGRRIDVVLVRRVDGLSRGRAKSLFDEGHVTINGRLAAKGQRIASGDRVRVAMVPGASGFEATPDPEIELLIVEETPDFVVVDKPVGMPSHPLRAGERGTVAGALLARYPEMRGVGYGAREPGILHRLDNDTSGLLLAARHQDAFRRLREELRAGRIDKRYVANCLGTVTAPAMVDLPIAADPHDRRKVRACRDPREAKRLRAQAARTEILASVPESTGSRVEVRANHARRHQIRVHLAAIGHPLLGDTLYGAPPNEDPHHHLRATGLRFEFDGRTIQVRV
ncbi:MAG: RluA family pseudouridine synthase [Polyangiales bacterium]